MKTDSQHSISRVKRSRQSAQASNDRLSRWYDAIARSEDRFVQAGLRQLDVKEGEKVLEIGFGTGRAVLALASAVGGSGNVHGIDLSPGMLRVTQTKVEQARLSARVELRCADAAALPFMAGLFDAVFMSFSLELFDTPEIPMVLDECRRVLRPGGRMCVVAMSKPPKPGLAVRIYEWLHGRFPQYLDCRPIFVKQALEQAGLQVLEAIADSMYGLPVEVVLGAKS